MSYFGFRDYVPVAVRRAKATRETEKLRKKGRTITPVVIEGRTIARQFWGKAWCDNLERYSDYLNRLPRGRAYVRNGSVVDLKMARSRIEALVSGSEIYTVTIEISTLPTARWKSIRQDCTGSIGSLVELLQGKLSKNVMERVCRTGDGLFTSPSEIKMRCSCPDGVLMCKHIAATLYGAGARLDAMPDLLFTLRGVEHSELIANAGTDLPIVTGGIASNRILADDDMAALFGVDLDSAPVSHIPRTRDPSAKSSTKRTAKSKVVTPPAKKPSAPVATSAPMKNSTGKARPTTTAASPPKLSTRKQPAAADKPASPVKGTAGAAKSASASPLKSEIVQSEQTQPRVRTRAARWINPLARRR
jgi:uncharacterized Zn finger protein